MSCGIWLLMPEWTPNFDGLEELLPTKRLRGFAASLGRLELADIFQV
jgi:hypothetical protein